ncbi:MAG TPA: hypothetical protein PKW97_11245 [Syntrophorhabdus sp.]|nr:hypothetical protein [Syntrophorhabdus sp.]
MRTYPSHVKKKRIPPPTNPIVDLADEKDKRRRKIQELSALVDDARQSCLSERRSGKKIDSLNRLYNSLQEGISLASEIRIIDQQIHILNRLTQEGSGILEQYLQQLQKLSDEVEKTLRRTKDKEGTPSGLDTQYNFDLKGRFHKTRDNVTTTYLPDIADFTLGGDWKTDHVFAQLYTEIVPQLRLPGGRIEPVRYGTDYGLNPDKKGLHKVLWQMLTSPEYHAHEKAYEESGKVLFFRRFFGRKREFDALTMISLLREASLKFVQVEMGRSRRIQTEINRPLQDRINDENRPILLKQFDNNGTETFCKLLTVRASHTMVHTVYAGASEVLVEELDPGRDRPQFINEGDPSRFIKMKVSPLHTLESYPHYRVYKAQYEAAKERRKKEGSVFAPHIHKLFNELGAEKGIRRIDDISIEGQMDRTALLLLYREVCEKAYKENQPLLAEFIHLDSRLTGDAETLYCPLIIENHNGTNMAAVCSKIEMFGDKILLRRGNFVSMGAINNYKDIYDRLVARHDYLSLLDSVDEFDRLFRAKINITWHSISEEAYKALMEKVKDYIDKLKRTSAPNEFRVFFQDMNNRLVRLFQELVNAINTAPGTFELMAGSGAPTDIKQDRL